MKCIDWKGVSTKVSLLLFVLLLELASTQTLLPYKTHFRGLGCIDNTGKRLRIF